MVLRAIRKSVSVEMLSHGIVLVSGAGTVVSKLLSRFMRQEGLTVIGLTRSEGTAAHVRSLAPDVEIVSTDTAGWKKKVRSLAGRRNIVAVADCVSGALTGAMAELLVDDGPIITFGGLSSEPIGLTGLQVTSRQLQIRGVTVGRWFTATSEATRQDDVDAALAIARSHPELFGVSDIFGFDEFRDAVREVESPDRRGFVLMRP
jgi:NADPH:quinone reductase-like Zn-dependent oxidoreductase